MKILDDSGVKHLVDRIKALIPIKVSTQNDGLIEKIPDLDDDTDPLVFLSNGTWGEYSNKCVGFHRFEVDEESNLWLIYDDVNDPPTYRLDEEGNLYISLDDNEVSDGN